VSQAYKEAICRSTEEDIVWTNKLAGTNSSVIDTPTVNEGGLRVHPIVGWLLRNPYTKTLVRTTMLMRALDKYKKAAFDDSVEIWQAGKGVGEITSIETCATVTEEFAPWRVE